MKLFKKRLTEPVQDSVEVEIISNYHYRIVEREWGNGDVDYIVQYSRTKEFWFGVPNLNPFDTADKAEKYIAALKLNSIVSRKVIS